jgi:hypothetical protein
MTRRPALDLLFGLLILAGLFCIACHAHGGQLETVTSSRPARLRKVTRITVLRPIRAKGRADAGYPFLQTTANCTRIVANVTGLLNPLSWIRP